MLTIAANSEPLLLRYCIDYARSRGCSVREPDSKARWMTPKELAIRTGLKAPTLHKRLNLPGCPAFEREQGKKRITSILAHERLISYLTQPMQPGRRLS
jgi:hypothetical protein